jgi:photosystem II stability/assembly factor-like uncharacterized protein
MKKATLLLFVAFSFFATQSFSQKNKKTEKVQSEIKKTEEIKKFGALTFRNIGPFRGGRTNAVTGVAGDPMTYYFGGVGGGIWKTDDAGITWSNISDGFLKSGSVGEIAIAPSDKNIIYVGMGEHAVRGVMTSHGDGVYKSMDAGKTWTHLGLEKSMHISSIEIHPENPDIVYVAVQGVVWAPSDDRGVYKTIDGGKTWKKVLFINGNTGASDLSMDETNPRILYAGMWDHQRFPWKVRSGGEGSGIWKTIDGGENWEKLSKGLPEQMGKVAVDVSPADPNRLYANIEAEKGGVYRSDDGGKSWNQTYSDRVSVARAWYYIEIFADPMNADIVYVLNAPVLKSIDGGKTFQRIPNPHTDQHDLWINADNPNNMILGNDGGACITFNGGKSWSTQNNQPTAQFYRVIADQQFPYHIYGGQQDNSTVCITSKTRGGSISDEDWYPVSGGESAFIAFDPKKPKMIYGTSIQGFIDSYDADTKEIKDIMAYPQLNLGTNPIDMKYRFNWNGPLASQIQDPSILYHGGNKLLRSNDEGYSWTEISTDLTRNDTSLHSDGGIPYTNEGAGGEVYNTISYIAPSPHQAGVIWVGTDDGFIQLTKDEGKTWSNVTPKDLNESLINAIEVSPHDPGRAYIAVTRYKFNDLSPIIYTTNDFGKSWIKITNGLPDNNYVRVVREDKIQKGLLYAGTESGLFISYNNGQNWESFQCNLPICPVTDLTIADNDLIVATSGRAFWILDDLGILQQSAGNIAQDKMMIFQPKDSYKFTTGANPKAKGAGQNPANGITFDYHLPKEWQDSSLLTLEVLDGKGSIIRTINNQKPKDFKSWEGGPQPPQVLPSTPGHNRFAWDLRRDALPAVTGVFVMGDYRGHLSPPGNYTFRIYSKTDTVETTVKLLADPRIKAREDDYRAQQKLLLQIESTVKDLHQSVNRFRSVKNQLENRLVLLREMEGKEELVKIGETALKNITTWEEQLIQPKQKTFQDVINFRNQLNAELLQLRSMIDSHIPKPTKGTEMRLNELLESWEQYKAEMNQIIETEIGGFNKAYQSRNIPALIIPKE